MPVADNETAEGRAKNRRTEIIMSPKLDKLFQMLKNKKDGKPLHQVALTCFTHTGSLSGLFIYRFIKGLIYRYRSCAPPVLPSALFRSVHTARPPPSSLSGNGSVAESE